MAAIFKSSLQNLRPLPTSLKVEPLAKPKTGLKFFVNITKPKGCCTQETTRHDQTY